ncbi:MAG: prepilin-type N-terminal cleavage/methylation domain-containing protein [Planctomycetes bacterium]|nr:prepilin-type N-terminal cleavage/methylation domain-containing protein [Planctomycetota bacterium]
MVHGTHIQTRAGRDQPSPGSTAASRAQGKAGRDARPPSSTDARRVQGFTLIEVLVVVAIIALLVSILLPSLAAARSRTRSTVCCTHLHTFGQAMQMYAQVYRGVIPRDYEYVKNHTEKNPMLLVPERFSPYLGGPRLPLVPRDLDPPSVTTASDRKIRDQVMARIFIKMDMMQCPSFPPWPGDPFNTDPLVVPESAYDYVVNAFVMDKALLDKNGHRVTDKTNFSKLDKVPLPAKLVYLIDANKTAWPDKFEFRDMFGPAAEEIRHLWWGSDPRMINDNRHDGRANGLFHDGHVESPLIRSVNLGFFTVSSLYDLSAPANRPPRP